MLYKCGVELTSPNPAAGLIENWCQAFITGSTRARKWNQLQSLAAILLTHEFFAGIFSGNLTYLLKITIFNKR
jgi:hypothetical protein